MSGAEAPRVDRSAGHLPDAPGNKWLYVYGQIVCRVFTTLYFDFKVYHIGRVPRRGGVLLVSNHQSVLDPILVAVRLPRKVSFMARATLFKNWFFGTLIRNLNAFPVQQGKGDTGAMKEAIARLQAGQLLTMFPEGTRSKTGELQPVLPGVSLIIRRAGVPVIPVVVDGAYKAWPKGRTLPQSVPVRVLYGEPLNVEGLKAEGITKLIEERFAEMMVELRSKP